MLGDTSLDNLCRPLFFFFAYAQRRFSHQDMALFMLFGTHGTLHQ